MGGKKQYVHLDILRVLAACFVVAVHATTPTVNEPMLFGTRTWWVCNAVNTLLRVCVPCFFMISGHLLLSDPKTADPLTFYKKRFKRLLVPFLFWDVLYFLLNCFLTGQSVDPYRFLRELFLQGSSYHLWFVYQIAALYLIAPYLKKIIDASDRRELWLFLFLILLVPTIFRFLNNVQPLIWFAPFGALVDGYVGYFLLGYLLGSWEFSPKARGVIYSLGVLAAIGGPLGNYLLTTPYDMRLPFNEGYSITLFLTGAALFLLVKSLARNVEGKAAALAHTVAGLSFGIYLSHVLVIKCLEELLARAGANLYYSGAILFIWFAASVLSTLLTYVLSKIPTVRRIVT